MVGGVGGLTIDLLMAASRRKTSRVTNVKLASQKTRGSTHSRPRSKKPKRIFEMWWHRWMTAEKSAATVWHCRVNKGPNLWGTFPAIYWIYAKKDEGRVAKRGVTRSQQGVCITVIHWSVHLGGGLVGKASNSTRLINPQHSKSLHLRSRLIFNSSCLLLCCLP